MPGVLLKPWYNSVPSQRGSALATRDVENIFTDIVERAKAMDPGNVFAIGNGVFGE